MSLSVTPFLMFEGKAEAAMTRYCEVIPDSRIVSINRYGPDANTGAGMVQLAEISLSGQRIRVIDSPQPHAFTFTPSASLFIDCDDAGQFDAIVAALGEDGEVLMPVDDYGFSKKYTWLTDRFGVSWQINLSA